MGHDLKLFAGNSKELQELSKQLPFDVGFVFFPACFNLNEGSFDCFWVFCVCKATEMKC